MKLTNRDLPAYTFVPGENPHPVSDPLGHSYGQAAKAPTPLSPERWQECECYLWGLDLYQHGYYWEAHEAWELLWNAHQRTGVIGDFLKGLIQFAVVGVKVLQQKPDSIKKHGRRAGELLESVQEHQNDRANFCGLDLTQLLALAERLAQGEVADLRIHVSTLE